MQVKFNTIEQRFDRHVVIPDLHGESKLFEQVVDSIDDDVGVVVLGDMIDKKGSFDEYNNTYITLEIVRQLGSRAIVTLANHEYFLLAHFNAEDRHLRRAYIEYYHEIKGTTLLDYDIFLEKKFLASEMLEESMQRAGHIALLDNITPYYETDKFIATHAGIEHQTPWEKQKKTLEKFTENMSKGIYPNLSEVEPPSQVFSFVNAVDTREITATDKIVLSGHAHHLGYRSVEAKSQNIAPSTDRVILDGQRIRLASQLNKPQNADLLVWQDWDESIVSFSNVRQKAKL